MVPSPDFGDDLSVLTSGSSRRLDRISRNTVKKDSPGSARSHVVSQRTKSAERCALCQKEHFILFCDDFRRKTPAQKKEVVEQHKLCLNCFGRHALANCTCKKFCAAIE